MSLFRDCYWLLSVCLYEINVCYVFQPCAPRLVPMEAPVCAGTSVCVLLAGLDLDATQVHQHPRRRYNEDHHCTRSYNWPTNGVKVLQSLTTFIKFRSSLVWKQTLNFLVIFEFHTISTVSCLLAVCELPCANSGRCVGPETCQCPSDYTGPQCLLRE